MANTFQVTIQFENYQIILESEDLSTIVSRLQEIKKSNSLIVESQFGYHVVSGERFQNLIAEIDRVLDSIPIPQTEQDEREQYIQELKTDLIPDIIEDLVAFQREYDLRSERDLDLIAGLIFDEWNKQLEAEVS